MHDRPQSVLMRNVAVSLRQAHLRERR